MCSSVRRRRSLRSCKIYNVSPGSSEAPSQTLDDGDLVIGSQWKDVAISPSHVLYHTTEVKLSNPRQQKSRGPIASQWSHTLALQSKLYRVKVRTFTEMLACSWQDQASGEHGLPCACLCLPCAHRMPAAAFAAGLLLSTAVALKFDGVVFSTECYFATDQFSVPSWSWAAQLVWGVDPFCYKVLEASQVGLDSVHSLW